MKWVAVISLGLLAAICVWIVAASYLYCLFSNHMDAFEFPYDQWFIAAPYWNYSGWRKIWVIGSAAAASAPYIAVFAAFYNGGKKLRRPFFGGLKPIERGVTNNHGNARLAIKRELIQTFGHKDGCLIGALERGSESRLLYDDLKDGPLHSLLFSGPGSYKTTSGVTRIWNYKGPRVVFDPSAEMGPIMTEALEATGHTVKTIGIRNSGIDALDWIDVSDPEVDVHINTAVDLIYDEKATIKSGDSQPQDPFWQQWGRSLIACIMAHMLYSKNSAFPKNLTTLRAGIRTSEKEMQSLLQDIHATSDSAMARDLAGGIMEMRAADTFSGIYSNAFAATAWLSVGAYADLVSRKSMKTSDILNDDVVVFIQTSLRSLLSTPAIGRAVLGSFFNALYHADGRGLGRRTMFMIDEAWTLGKLNEIKLLYTTARKYNGLIQTLWQSEGQMEGVWGKDDSKMLRDSSSWRAYGAVQDGEVAERISRDFGEHGVMAHSEGINRGRSASGVIGNGSRSSGSNTNMHEIKRRLIKSDEITRADPDELFVLFRGFPYPIRAFAAPYFRYPKIEAQMNASRFVRSSLA